MHIISAATALFLPTAALAAPTPGSDSTSNGTVACAFHSANSPSCWGRYSLSTNYYDEVPNTGVVREYWWELRNTTIAPDGVERLGMTINGSFPGPTITADWGDTIVVHVTNALEHNGTSIHFHGLRQHHTAEHDGVASITQCPVAPGDSISYRWRATQYGSSWYHSHFSLQAWNGIIGSMVINGPASAPYDVDTGPIMLLDWHHQTVDQLYMAASTGGPPQAQNGLINGLNVYGDGGQRFHTTFGGGKRHRLRIVNGAIDTHFKFHIDNHTLTVIAADFVPIVPYQTDYISVGMGQRYDVIVEADQAPGNYWMRAVPQTACSSNEMTVNIKGIVSYDTVYVAEPDTDAKDVYLDDCADEPASKLVPSVPLDVDHDSVTHLFDMGLDASTGIFKWTINNNSFLTDWAKPTLLTALDPGAVYGVQEHVVLLPETEAWVYFVIESRLALDHPIHLHGHDSFILEQRASAVYDPLSARLKLTNPPRRDVAMLPAAGYLVIGFVTDNPGAWLLHCHIGWHTSQGFAVQLVERASEMATTVDSVALERTCARWDGYVAASGTVQEDSGI